MKRETAIQVFRGIYFKEPTTARDLRIIKKMIDGACLYHAVHECAEEDGKAEDRCPCAKCRREDGKRPIHWPHS